MTALRVPRVVLGLDSLDWRELRDDALQPYYWNVRTNRTTRVHPSQHAVELIRELRAHPRFAERFAARDDGQKNGRAERKGWTS